MKCPNCSNEQVKGAFCSNCGSKLVENTEDQSTNQQDNRNKAISPEPQRTNLQKNDSEKEEPGQQRFQQIHHGNNKTKLKNDQPKKKKNKVTITEFKIASYFSVGALAMIVIIAWGLTHLLKSSILIKDYTYMFLTSITDIPEDIMIRTISTIKVTIWDILLVAHGGSANGEILVDGMEPVQFVWKLPVIVAPLLLLFILIVISRFLKKKFSFTMKQSVHIMFLSACLYAIIVMGMMLFMNPSYGVEGQFLYKISTQPVIMFIRAFIFVVIASFIGFKLWESKSIQKIVFMRPIFSLKPFIITLCSGLIIVGIVIIAMWALVHPASIFSQPLTTPASLWTLYRTDPLFYLLLPTFWFGELLYSVGSSFTITNAEIGELLQIPQGLRFHTLTGIRVLEGPIVDENHLRLIEKSTQLIWYSFAFLLVFLYALHQVKSTNLRALMIQTIFIGAIFSCVAMAISFTFTSSSENIAGTIGFPVLLSGVATIVVSAIYFTLRSILKSKFLNTKEGEQNVDK